MNYAIFVQFLIVLSLSLSVSCSNDDVSVNPVLTPDNIDLPRLEGRIVNGTKAGAAQFPHQVSLRRSFSNSHFCGGSVISAQWILTAAHCMFKNNGAQIQPWTITVIGGQLRLSDVSGQRRAVEAIIVHPFFDGMTLTNDVALLKLKLPLQFNTVNIKPAVLGRTMQPPGTMCKVSGWGYLAENKTVVSNDLMYVSLPLISPLHCRKLLVNVTHLPLGMFCAGYEQGLKDACQGDSGGGMICGNTLIGVVSGGEGCARPALPGLYADVPYYRNWIENQMRNFNVTNGKTNIPENVTKPGKNNSSKAHSFLSLFSLVAAYSLLSLPMFINFV